jgi:crotonobetainyl-CoA:carnitine CoA-transferase CaiB-like acyl-CoA transferase
MIADSSAEAPAPLLADLRVVIVDAGLSGGYAGRLLADQGAEVIHIEPPRGTELSRRSAEAGSPPGAVYAHLTAGTRRLRLDTANPRSLARAEAIVHECDAVLLDGIGAYGSPTLSRDRIRPWCAGRLLATVTLWGADSPFAGRAGNEFTLQAAVGGTGARGDRDAPPLSADGDRGLWHTGAYAAISLLAAIGTAAARRPTEIDIAAFECMVTAWNLFEWVRRQLWDPPRDLARWTDVPGIERASDGWVGFSLVTPSQWSAYCEMTDAAHLADEPALRQMTGRIAARDDIRAATEPWLTRHTVDEIVAAASARRIPAVPVMPAGRLPEMEHFRQRGTFLPATSTLPQRPAPPYKIDGSRRFRDEAVQDLDGQPADAAVWAERATPPAPVDFAGVGVLDLTAFYAGPYAAQVLAILGADAVHVESARGYDGMRNVTTRPRTEPGWWEFSYVYQGAQAGKRAAAIDLSSPASAHLLDRLLTKYDIVLENFSRDVAPRLGLVYDELAARNPGVIFLRSPGFGLDGPWSHLRAFAMTGDQISGLAWRTGWEGGRPTSPRTIGDSFTALHSAFAVIAAMRRRAVTGRGAFIEMSSMEVSINLAAEEVVEWTAHGIEMGRTGNRSSRVAPQGVYAAAGVDTWIAVSVDTDEAWKALLGVLGDVVTAPDVSSWTAADRVLRQEEIDGWITAWTSTRPAEPAVAALQTVGVAAELVPLASHLASDDRLRDRGYFFPFEHPLAGVLDYSGLPWLMDGLRAGPSGPAPLFGEHTVDVLREVGVPLEEIAALASGGVVGGTPPLEPPAART